MNNTSMYKDLAYCGNCGEYKPRMPRCPECGKMVRLWPKPCRKNKK